MKPLRDGCAAITELLTCFGVYLLDATTVLLNSCSSAGCLDPNHKLPVASQQRICCTYLCPRPQETATQPCEQVQVHCAMPWCDSTNLIAKERGCTRQLQTTRRAVTKCRRWLVRPREEIAQ